MIIVYMEFDVFVNNVFLFFYEIENFHGYSESLNNTG